MNFAPVSFLFLAYMTKSHLMTKIYLGLYCLVIAMEVDTIVRTVNCNKINRIIIAFYAPLIWPLIALMQCVFSVLNCFLMPEHNEIHEIERIQWRQARPETVFDFPFQVFWINTVKDDKESALIAVVSLVAYMRLFGIL